MENGNLGFNRPFAIDRASWGNDDTLKGGFLGSPTYAKPYRFGTFIREYFADLIAWTNGGGPASFSVSGNKLTCSGGSGLYTNRIVNNYVNALDAWKITTLFKVTATNGGFGVGIQEMKDDDSTNRSFVARFITTASGNGTCIIAKCNEGSTTVTAGVTSAALTYAVNDMILMTFERTQQTYTVYLENITNPNSVTASYLANNANVKAPNPAAKFGIYSFGGTQVVDYVEISSDEYRNVRAMFIGDSITHGLQVSPSDNYPHQIFAGSPYKFIINAGSSDTTGQYSIQEEHIAKCSADFVFLMIGGNDILNAYPAATYQDNYKQLRNIAARYSKKVVHLLATPRNALDITPLNNFILTAPEFSNDIIIDTYTPLLGPTGLLLTAYNQGDGVHLTPAGYARVAQVIKGKMPNLF